MVKKKFFWNKTFLRINLVVQIFAWAKNLHTIGNVCSKMLPKRQHLGFHQFWTSENVVKKATKTENRSKTCSKCCQKGNIYRPGNHRVNKVENKSIDDEVTEVRNFLSILDKEPDFSSSESTSSISSNSSFNKVNSSPTRKPKTMQNKINTTIQRLSSDKLCKQALNMIKILPSLQIGSIYSKQNHTIIRKES